MRMTIEKNEANLSRLNETDIEDKLLMEHFTTFDQDIYSIDKQTINNNCPIARLCPLRF